MKRDSVYITVQLYQKIPNKNKDLFSVIIAEKFDFAARFAMMVACFLLLKRQGDSV
jgi:hypothetical protein